jgi:transposase
MITLVARTRQPETICPNCGRSAIRVQSRYTRTVADLPCHGIPVQIQLRLRRFFCDQSHCSTAIFTERLPTLVEHYSRRTRRQAQTCTEPLSWALPSF